MQLVGFLVEFFTEEMNNFEIIILCIEKNILQTPLKERRRRNASVYLFSFNHCHLRNFK